MEDTDVKPKKRGPKPGFRRKETSLAVKERVAEVEKMLALQMGHTDIVNTVVKRFPVSERTARNDIKRAYEKWDAECLAEKPYRRGQLRQTLRKLLQMALKKSDLRAAIAVCDRLARLDGLNEVTQLEVTAKVEADLDKMTSDDKRRRLDELLGKAYSRRASANGANGAANGANGSGGLTN
jgi:hypothetical protein